MNAWSLLGWTAALGTAVVIVTISVLIVVMAWTTTRRELTRRGRTDRRTASPDQLSERRGNNQPR